MRVCITWGQSERLFNQARRSCVQDMAAPYQVGSQLEDVGDPHVVVALMAAAGLDEHADLGDGGIVLQGGDHQSTGELGHLDGTEDERVITVTNRRVQTHRKKN